MPANGGAIDDGGAWAEFCLSLDGPLSVEQAVQVLELPTSPPPDAATVKAAYRRLSLRWHPDKHRGDEARATSLFKTVAAAYATLTTTNFDFERWSTAFAIPPLQTLDDVLALAMSGADPARIEELLQRRGEYRPHARFGVDVTVPWTAGSRAEPSWDEAASAHTTTRALDGAPPSGGASTALVLPSLAAASLAEDATRAVGCSDARPWERVGADGGAWGGAKPKAAPKQTPLPPVLHPDMEPGDAGAAAAAASCASAGAAAESRGASRSAAECFSEALRLHPASEAAHDWAVRASSAWARVKDWAGAVECARAAAAAAPTPPQQVAAHVLLGRACLGRADASEAGGAAALSRDALKRTLLDARDAFRAAKAADPHSAAAVAGAKEAGLAWMAEFSDDDD